MNLFQKYGIKEVADVVFYSITPVGDEEFYTPVLFLDTLKVSTLEKSAEKVEAKGGKGNKKLITWNFGKEITLNLEDALFSPASMSMIWGGKLNAKLSDYTSAIVKCNIANKYGEQHFSTKAYPSPALTDNEWDIIFNVLSGEPLTQEEVLGRDFSFTYGNDDKKYIATFMPSNNEEIDGTIGINGGEGYVYKLDRTLDNKFNYLSIQKLDDGRIGHYDQMYLMNKGNFIEGNCCFMTDYNQGYMQGDTNANNYQGQVLNTLEPESTFTDESKVEIIKQYFHRTGVPETERAMPKDILKKVLSKITELKDIGYIDTDMHDLEVIDRWEKCIVKKKEGQVISIKQQKRNLFRYYADDQSSSYTIYYDAKTMLPLLPIEDGFIQGWDTDNGTPEDLTDDEGASEYPDEFRIKLGTVYYKWTRTVKRKEAEDDGILGKTLVIDAETFPDAYRIVGETYIRNQKTGKDQRYQFTIFRANVSSDTSVTLEAEGDPTTFSMQVDVLTPPNDIMMELKQYDVEEDVLEGGTRIVPQKSKYSYTPTNIEFVQSVRETNEEIY